MYGKRLKKLLEDKNIKQNKLSKLINVPPTTINSWMDKYYIRLENIEKVCKALDIEIWEFFIEDFSKIYSIPKEFVDLVKRIENLRKEKKEKIIIIINEVLNLLDSSS